MSLPQPGHHHYDNHHYYYDDDHHHHEDGDVDDGNDEDCGFVGVGNYVSDGFDKHSFCAQSNICLIIYQIF